MADLLTMGRRLNRPLHSDTSRCTSDYLTGSKGHPRDLPLLGFIAEKQSSRFRFPEAVVPSRQERALCRHWQEMEADVRRLVTPSFINDAIRNGIDYVTSSVLH